MTAIERAMERTPCPYCNGTGADPLSDNLNALPCASCNGSGQAKRHTDQQLAQIDALIDSIQQIQAANRRLREADINTGVGLRAIGFLSFAEDAMRDHLAAIGAPGGVNGDGLPDTAYPTCNGTGAVLPDDYHPGDKTCPECSVTSLDDEILDAAETRRLAEQARYALNKQLSTAHTLEGTYGGLELDEELRQAIEEVLTPILKRRAGETIEGADMISFLHHLAGDLKTAYERLDDMTDTLSGRLGDLFDLLRFANRAAIEAATELAGEVRL